jgi:hypothetical protein
MVRIVIPMDGRLFTSRASRISDRVNRPDLIAEGNCMNTITTIESSMRSGTPLMGELKRALHTTSDVSRAIITKIQELPAALNPAISRSNAQATDFSPVGFDDFCSAIIYQDQLDVVYYLSHCLEITTFRLRNSFM